MDARGTSAGFTRVELITVMTVSAILAVVVWRSISGPLLGFVDLSRRAEWVDHGETALLRIARELKLALPNSVRISADRWTLEFLRTAWGGHYRAEVDLGDPTSDALDLSLTQDSLQMLDVPSTVSGIVSWAGAASLCRLSHHAGARYPATGQFSAVSGACRLLHFYLRSGQFVTRRPRDHHLGVGGH